MQMPTMLVSAMNVNYPGQVPSTRGILSWIHMHASSIRSIDCVILELLSALIWTVHIVGVYIQLTVVWYKNQLHWGKQTNARLHYVVLF